MAPSVPNDIVLFTYGFSPYGRQISNYLALRRIKHAVCAQPMVISEPEKGGRPDLMQLGVRYRRIPVLAIGRDVYCDTRLILPVLEQRFPEDRLGGTTAEAKAIEKLLERWTSEGGVFMNAAGCIPPESPTMQDQGFLKDRTSFTGTTWSEEAQRRNRPDRIMGMRDAFALVESLLGDGREWILQTEQPSLADVKASWPFQFVMPFVPPNCTASDFPRTHAWVKRFAGAVRSGAQQAPAVDMAPAEAIAFVKNARVTAETGRVDEQDPLRLQAGAHVTVFPTDTGFASKDTGALVKLTVDEIVIAVDPVGGRQKIHVHFPRWGYRVVAGAASKGRL